MNTQKLEEELQELKDRWDSLDRYASMLLLKESNVKEEFENLTKTMDVLNQEMKEIEKRIKNNLK